MNWEAAHWEMRLAIRRLLRAPLTVAVVVLCIGASVGVVATSASIVDAVFLRAPPHVREPGSLWRVRQQLVFASGAKVPLLEAEGFSLFEVDVLATEASRFSGVAAYSTHALPVTFGDDVEGIAVSFVTSSFFEVLGVMQSRGRPFAIAGITPLESAEPLAVISHVLWQTRFGGTPDILDRTITVARRPYAIVGVFPPGFRGLDPGNVHIWLPVSAALFALHDGRRADFEAARWLELVGRVDPSVRLADAAFEASAAWQAAFTSRFGPGLGFTIDARLEPAVGNAELRAQVGSTVTMASVVSLALLLMAGANTAGVLLTRSMARLGEWRLRTALGSGTPRLLLGTAIEALLVSILGVTTGVSLAWWIGSDLAVYFLPELAPAGPLVSGRVLIAAVVLALALAAAIAILPAVWICRRSGSIVRGAGGSDSMVARRAGGLLLVLQLSLTTILLVAVGAVWSSYRTMEQTPLGFVSEQVVVAPTTHVDAPLPGSSRFARIHYALERLRAVPGVVHVSLAGAAPFVHTVAWSDYRVPGVAPERNVAPLRPHLFLVGPDYFEILGIRAVRGRLFTAAEYSVGEVAVVNLAFARAVFGTDQVLGRCIQMGLPLPNWSSADQPCREIVGVVADSRVQHLREPALPQYFAPLRAEHRMANVILAKVDRREAIAAIRAQLQADLQSPLVDVRPLTSFVESELRALHVGRLLFTLYAGVAVTVAALGVHVGVSARTARRRHEWAVRLALGASPRRLTRDTIGESLVIAAIATLGAVAGGAVVSSVLRNRLLRLEVAIEWPHVGLAVLLMTAVVVIATVLPAARSARAAQLGLARQL